MWSGSWGYSTERTEGGGICCHELTWSFLCLLFRPSGPSKALKLGAKGKEVDNFVDKLKSEGENIMTAVGKRSTEAAKVLAPPVNMERWVLPSCRSSSLSNARVASSLVVRTSLYPAVWVFCARSACWFLKLVGKILESTVAKEPIANS